MLALIRWITGFALTIIFVFFAAFNRQSVDLYFSPVHDPLQMPLFAAVLGFSALAFLVGGAIVWMNDGKIRRERRGLRKEVKKLEKELDAGESQPSKQPQNILFPEHNKTKMIAHDG